MWDVKDLDLLDDLNARIWAESPAIQARIARPHQGREGEVGSAQALIGTTALPWVPDLVGHRWREPGSILAFGASYADFFTTFAQRRRRLDLAAYHSARDAGEFQRAFVTTVVAVDNSYYMPLAALFHAAGVALDRVVLADLCRASFIRISNRRSYADEGVLRANAMQFEKYVEANREWTVERITRSGAAIAVGVGRLATAGLIETLLTSGWTGAPSRRARWVTRSSASALVTLVSPSGRVLQVLYVAHPGAWGPVGPSHAAPQLARLLTTGLAVVGSHSQPTAVRSGAGGSATPARSGANREALWRALFEPAVPLAVAQVLALHPDAARKTRELIEPPSARRIIAIANAMYNACRIKTLRPNKEDAASVEAWGILLNRKDRPFVQSGTKWERLANALDPIPSWAAQRLRSMNIVELGSVAEALIRGPYKRI